MVVAAAVLVVGDHEQRARPRRPVAQGVVDVVDELFAEGDVVIGVLAVAGRFPAGFEETERSERPLRGRRLKVCEKAEVRFVGFGDVGESLAGERRAVVAVDRPAGAAADPSSPKMLGEVKVLVLSSMWPWLVAAPAKALFGKVSVGTDENHWSQTANPRPGPKGRAGSPV